MKTTGTDPSTRARTNSVVGITCAPEKVDGAHFLHQPHTGVRPPHHQNRPAPSYASAPSLATEERQRARNYPFSRWYLRPAAGWLARRFAPTRVRPVLLTACGAAAAGMAAVVLLHWPQRKLATAGLVLLYWFFDRADGQLARRQGTVSAWGAWLDGNVDELVDVGLHVAIATVVARQTGASWPWLLLVAFLAGKYLLMYGLTLEEHVQQTGPPPAVPGGSSLLGRVYHSLGNADTRIHVLALVLAAGWLASELIMVAVYYNFRWIVRYVLVARRLRGAR